MVLTFCEWGYGVLSLPYRVKRKETVNRDENPIRTLGDYSRPSHEGYRNTIELLQGNNVDFLKLVDSLDLDGENKERAGLRLFQFSLRDQASNWLERLPAGSISTWEDLTTRFLAYFFLPGRTAKLRNDILMFQQHHGESLSEAWTHFKDLLQKVPHHGIDLWLQVQFFYDHVNPVTRRTINQSASEGLVSEFMASQDARLSNFEADFKQQQSKMTNKLDTVLKAITDRIAGTLSSNTVKNLNWGLIQFRLLVLTQQWTRTAQRKFTARSTPSRSTPSYKAIPMMTKPKRMRKKRKRQPRKPFQLFYTTQSINFIHHQKGNFAYVIDFMIVKNISSILDPRLSQVEGDGVADDNYKKALVFDDDQYKEEIKKNRCQFMIPVLKMLLGKKKDLSRKEDLMGKEDKIEDVVVVANDPNYFKC
nr:hypothetical protein [Tanacetum cinerariifolium]